jgi:two-component system, chemotaxis family, sensor kinase CheA
MTQARDTEPERDPETLELFIEESLDALQQVERLLVDAEAGKTPADIMSVLFRQIHTIKGTSGFLALDRILGLSHVAEDLLSLLREKTLIAQPHHFTHLMEVGDLLGKMVRHVKEFGDEGPYDVAPLVAKLRQDIASSSGEGHVAASLAPDPSLDEPAATPPKLGEILVAQKSITSTQLADALEEQQRSRGETPTRVAESADGTVRVNVAVLDRLMNLIGELVLARNQTVQILKSSRDATINAQAACQRLNLVTSDLQEQVMKTRMQPIARVFEKIPRMVRDLSRATGKEVACQIEGTSTEIDKALVEAVRDPLMHIVRNAIDHGIEAPEVRIRAGKSVTGKLTVRASHEGGMVSIEIEDDGAGMDPKVLRAHAVKKSLLTQLEADRLSDREALELVFRPGFSTAPAVTDISGRGVGMDVVRSHLERAGGQAEIESTVLKGSVVRLKMPLTLAIIPSLLVRTAGQRFAIPQVNLLELVYLNEEQVDKAIEQVRGASIYRLRGEVLPLASLDRVLGLSACTDRPEVRKPVNIVVVAVGTRRYGLLVDEIHDTEEIVIKPLLGQLKRLPCYSGATVLGDGGVALILDVAGVAGLAGIDVAMQRREVVAQTHQNKSRAQPFIVFRAGDGAHCAVPLAMVARLEQVPRNKIERVAGNEVLQYRDAIMPIVRPETVLPIGVDATTRSDQPLIVFDFGHMVGMAVSGIVDVVAIDVDQVDVDGVDRELTLGQVVVFGHTTLLIDVYRIVRQLAPQFVQERRKQERRQRILLADDSNAMRAALSGYLRASGFDVVDVSNGDAALRELRAPSHGTYDAVVTDIEMPGTDGHAVISVLRREQPQLPVFVWTYDDDARLAARVVANGARACIHKLKREQLMGALVAHGVGAGRRAVDSEEMHS